MNPYALSGPAQICFSGGRTSGYMLWHLLDANDGLPDDCYVTFQNTGKERAETLAFVHACETRWNVPINWLEWDGFDGVQDRSRVREVNYETASRAGEPFAKLIATLGKVPSPAMRVCTGHMKSRTGAAFMRSRGFDDWDNVMGIRADEPLRVARLTSPDAKPKFGTPDLPLARANVTKRDVLTFWAGQPFDLGLEPLALLGNCDLCFLKPRRQLVAAIQREPARAVWWIEQEQRIGRQFRQDRPSYRDLLREAQFNDRQLLLDLADVDEPLIDCVCGD